MRDERRRPIVAIAIAATFALSSIGLSGCEQDGPAESAGEEIDEAVEEAEDNLEDAAEDVEDENDRDG